MNPQEIADNLIDPYVGIAMDQDKQWYMLSRKPPFRFDFPLLYGIQFDESFLSEKLHINLDYKGEWGDSWHEKKTKKKMNLQYWVDHFLEEPYVALAKDMKGKWNKFGKIPSLIDSEFWNEYTLSCQEENFITEFEFLENLENIFYEESLHIKTSYLDSLKRVGELINEREK